MMALSQKRSKIRFGPPVRQKPEQVVRILREEIKRLKLKISDLHDDVSFEHEMREDIANQYKNRAETDAAVAADQQIRATVALRKLVKDLQDQLALARLPHPDF